MQDLVRLSVQAHGGLDLWNEVQQISARFQPGGVGLVQRGQEAFTKLPTRVTVNTRVQQTILAPFLNHGEYATFAPNRTTIEIPEGPVLDELEHPRDSFASMVKGTPWKPTQLAYFVGYAMWMYLTVPFSLLREGVVCEEIEPWTEDGETWRALKVTFPPSYVTHSREQTIYFDEKGLIRRHDYIAEVSGNVRVAHYVYDHTTFDGLVFPTRRRVHPCGPDRKAQKDLVVISADLSDFQISRVNS